MNESIKYSVDDLPVEVAINKSKAAGSEDLYKIIKFVGVFLLVVAVLWIALGFLEHGNFINNHIANIMIMFGISMSGLAMHKDLSIQMDSKAVFDSELERLLSFSINELPEGKKLAFDLVQIRKTDDIYRIRLVDTVDGNA